MSQASPIPPQKPKPSKGASSSLVLSRSSRQHSLPNKEMHRRAVMACNEIWEELLHEDEYFIDAVIDTVHDYLDHLAADCSASIFKETVVSESIPLLAEVSIQEEMIFATVVDEVVFEQTDGLVETMYDVGHFILPDHDHEEYGEEIDDYLNHIEDAAKKFMKRKLALHTHRVKEKKTVKENVKENRHIALELSPFLRKKAGIESAEDKIENKRRESIVRHSSFLRRKHGSM